jgi:hypothetical protein
MDERLLLLENFQGLVEITALRVDDRGLLLDY